MISISLEADCGIRKKPGAILFVRLKAAVAGELMKIRSSLQNGRNGSGPDPSIVTRYNFVLWLNLKVEYPVASSAFVHLYSLVNPWYNIAGGNLLAEMVAGKDQLTCFQMDGKGQPAIYN
jgi:hypothetical protein